MREQKDIAISLMIAVGMIIFGEFVQRPPQGVLAQKQSIGYQPRMVSGRATIATSPRTCSHDTSVARLASESFS